MPDDRWTSPREADALLKLTQALRLMVAAQRSGDEQLPRELREVVAAGDLVEMAKELERETVRVARGIGRREGQRAVFTATGAARSSNRYSWAAIGAAVGVTAQSAHERWAQRISPHQRLLSRGARSDEMDQRRVKLSLDDPGAVDVGVPGRGPSR